MENELLHFVLKYYRQQEIPCILKQFESWQKNKPLFGVKIFDGAPVFRNTCAKYAALLAGGAKLTVGITDNFFYDKEIYSMLPSYGIKTVRNEFSGGDYDVVLDCAGLHHQKQPTRGFAELTRTGVPFYENSDKPCFSVDDSKTKLLEDFLGTGDGFLRGLEANCNRDIKQMSLLVFGFGKVGKGICMRMRQAGAKVRVVDDLGKVEPLFDIPIIDLHDVGTVISAVAEADCIVTATGVAGALHGRYPAKHFLRDDLVLANMGVEDEFGAEIDDKRVLADNKPLNFTLDEPTKMGFIEGVMALHNEAALYLLENDCPAGVFSTPAKLDERIYQRTKEYGEITEDLKLLDMLTKE